MKYGACQDAIKDMLVGREVILKKFDKKNKKDIKHYKLGDLGSRLTSALMGYRIGLYKQAS